MSELINSDEAPNAMQPVETTDNWSEFIRSVISVTTHMLWSMISHTHQNKYAICNDGATIKLYLSPALNSRTIVLSNYYLLRL